MKTLKFITLCLALSIVTAQSAMAAEKSRRFKTLQGTMDLDMTGDALSANAQREVKVLKVKEHRDPYRRGSRDTSTYQMNILIDQNHYAECELVLFKIVQQAGIFNCESDTTEISFRGFTNYSDLGI